MVARAICRPALRLLLLCAVWAACVPAQGSIRPSSPEEFRKMLLWAERAADRSLNRGGVIPPYPSADQLNEVDQVWAKTHRKEDLLGPPRPYVEASQFRHRYPSSFTEEKKTHSVSTHSSEQESSTKFHPRYPTSPELTSYSEPSRTHPDPSSTERDPPSVDFYPKLPEASPGIITTDKKAFPFSTKKNDYRPKPISETLTYFTDDSPDSEKKLETLSHASIIYVNDSLHRESLHDLFGYAGRRDNASGGSQDIQNSTDSKKGASVGVKDNETQASALRVAEVSKDIPALRMAEVSKDTPAVRVAEVSKNIPALRVADGSASEKRNAAAPTTPGNTHPLPENPPPVWGHSLLSDELSGASVSRLPAYEEYDRNDRYSHSILHGFTGF